MFNAALADMYEFLPWSEILPDYCLTSTQSPAPTSIMTNVGVFPTLFYLNSCPMASTC